MQLLKFFFYYLSPACNNLIYYGYSNGTETVVISEHKKSGRARTLSPEQELFIVLVRLCCGLLLEDVAHLFNFSFSHVSRIWVTWVNFLHQQLRILPIWPSRAFVDENMPQCFKGDSLRSRQYSRAQGGKLEIPPAQKLSILSSPAAR